VQGLRSFGQIEITACGFLDESELMKVHNENP
jgi:hypothetical protein